MHLSQEILSDITVFSKYAKFIPDQQRRETWAEIVTRNRDMHVKKFPALKDEIKAVYKDFVMTKKVLPSMRSMQFAGKPIELSNTRIFNCSYLPIDHPVAFAEVMFLLLSGTGVGYSVQKHHIENLPTIVGCTDRSRRFLIGDSIEGWADAVKTLIKAFTTGKPAPLFDYGDIRAKGTLLVTSGGRAPGPDPLRICLEHIRSVLGGAVGRKLQPIEVHDICCHIADAVLAGGIRRAAMISLFDATDMDMLSSKSGNWWELNPQRGRANNSVVLDRDATTEEQFKSIWARVELSGAGEPGFYWTNDKNWGTNPCVEIALRPNQFCNVTEVNASDVEDQEELNARVVAASFLGTIQASYTNLHYLRDIWKETTEKDALIGVSMTGIASGALSDLNLTEATEKVKEENVRVAGIIGINVAARTTCVKPAGTTSLALGTSSGIHAWHAEYYIRRMRVNKEEPLYKYMIKNFPALIEDCKFKPHLEAVMSFPQHAPEGSTFRTESVHNLLRRVRRFNKSWVAPGHRDGANKHNVSCTISIKPREWESVGNWMWENRTSYTGISVLPYDNGSYVQAPFEDCTKEVYDELVGHLKSINLKNIKEERDNTTLSEQAACAGGVCEISSA